MIKLFQVSFPVSVLALVLLDTCIIWCCFILAIYIVLADSTTIYLFYENGLLASGMATVAIVLCMYINDLYSNVRIRSWTLLIQNVVMAIGVMFLAQAVIAYVVGEAVLMRRVLFIGAGVLLVCLPLWRGLYSRVLYKGFGIQRLLFLGTDTPGIEIAKYIEERPEIGLSTIGFTGDVSPVPDIPMLGSMKDLQAIAAKTRPNRIIVNVAERRQTLPVDLLLTLRFSGVRIEEVSVLYEQAFGRVSVQRLRPSQLIFSAELGPQPWKMKLQTVYSFLVAIFGLIVAAPIMALVAIAVRVTSPGPILYRQTRVGLNGAHFSIYKFRTMVANAEAATGAVWATRNDPRITRIGSFLRKTRLDELPQLFNIAAGKMSIVGPRPERPEFVDVLSNQIPFYRQRHVVKPGLTGWAQINYKYGDTVEDTIVKLEYDLYYIKNLSPSLDLYIMFHTAKVMLFSSHGQ
jgi:sugar transferase (PEP-CTERM system associated)